jgi:hypothetical protein
MKALGVALAVCCAAVLTPSTAHADTIGAQTAAAVCMMGSSAQLSEHVSVDLTADNRTEVVNAIRVTGSLDLPGLGLHLGWFDLEGQHGEDEHGEGPLASAHNLRVGPRGLSARVTGASTSATPEPASMLLVATGLAGLLFYRRRLFA